MIGDQRHKHQAQAKGERGASDHGFERLLRANASLRAEVFRLKERNEHLERAGLRTDRGCDCEHDYRCGRCQAVVDLHVLIESD
jgi:hypothetical protein